MRISHIFSFFIALLFPMSVLAHEHQMFIIGDKTYDFTVGSLNEPTVIDDKAGVEFALWTVNDRKSLEAPVEGIQATLKVEVQAAGQKRVFDLAPAWGEPGSYHAVFYPTVEAVYSYRFFGTINNTAVDLLFTCNAHGHDMAATDVDNTEQKISDGVTRIQKRGSFGCPRPKADFGFPKPAASLIALQSSGKVAIALSSFGAIAGLMGLALGFSAWKKASRTA